MLNINVSRAFPRPYDPDVPVNVSPVLAGHATIDPAAAEDRAINVR
jgi:hypothetical protein